MSRSRRAEASALQSIAAAWVLSLAVDFFLHGGLLAHLYTAPAPFLLPPEEAFRRIPLGYLAFLLLTVGLWWLFRRLGVRGAVSGLRLGGSAGALVWGALALGLYSITPMTGAILASWWIGQSVELALAGATLAAAADGVPMRRIWAMVGLVLVACIVATVVLQSVGWAPQMKVGR